MKNSVFSIAYLEYMHECLKKDIIDSYIPMFCECISKQSGGTVDMGLIRQSMRELYGITNLTQGAVNSICERMTTGSNPILRRDQGQLLINKDILAKSTVSLNANDNILADYDRLVAGIAAFSEKFPKTYSEEEVSDGLLLFLENHDIDILIQQDTTLFQKITTHDDKRLAYVIARYVLESEKKGGDALNILTRLAKGNAITNLVCFSGLSAYAGKLDDVTVFIDTPFFYDLLGANGVPNKDSAEELMSILEENGAKFAMYRHNYNEVCTNLEDVINKLRTGIYDIRNSSRLLRMAVSEHFSSIQMQLMLDNVDRVVSKWNINKPDNPDIPHGYQDIDIKELERIITEQYTNHRSRKLFAYELSMMSIDIDSILYTYRIRGNTLARSLKSSKAIFLTTNRAIAKAANEPSINQKKHQIPVCATDVFLSTILWTNYPRENESLNRKLLISQCFNTIQLSESLIAKYFEDLKEKRLDESISESQYLVLTTSKVALSLLGDKTLNDINAYTDRTTSEILDILEQEHKEEILSLREQHEAEMAAVEEANDNKIAELEASHSKELSDKDDTINELSDTVNHTEQTCIHTARMWANVISGAITVIIAFLFLVKTFVPDGFWNKHICLSRFWLIFNLLLALWAVFNWIGIIPKFVDLKSKIYNRIYSRMAKRFLNRNV